MPADLSSIKAQKLPNTDKEKHKKEYESLLNLFYNLIKDIRNGQDKWVSLEELMAERANFAIRHAFDGFGISYEEALKIIREEEDLIDDQRVKRDMLLAAVDNLVDFSVAQEYQLYEELSEYEEDILQLEEEEDDDDVMEAVLALFSKYNNRYAFVENMDIEYAMIVAAYLSNFKNNDVLMYMTMGDERVRPWHLQYEGFTATRSQFPSWLIPPIEHQCRCYLIEDTSSNILSKVKSQKEPEMPDWFDRTFKESVANGGRIFSDEHPYFSVNEMYFDKLREIAKRIKSQYISNA